MVTRKPSVENVTNPGAVRQKKASHYNHNDWTYIGLKRISNQTMIKSDALEHWVKDFYGYAFGWNQKIDRLRVFYFLFF